MSKYIKYRQKLQAQGLCPVCRKPMDREGYSCSECLAKENERHKDDVKRLIELGFCRVCQKNKTVPNSSYCDACLQRMYVYNRQRYIDNPEYFREANRNSQRKMYRNRKENGICTRCGKRKAKEGKAKCQICLNEDAERHAIRYEGITCSDRAELGICRFCDNPVKDGYRTCEKHYQMCCDAAKKAAKAKRIKYELQEDICNEKRA